MPKHKIIQFQNTQMRTKLIDGQRYVRSSDIARALGYKEVQSVSRLYRKNEDEFSKDMLRRVELTLPNGNTYKAHYFNRRGAWLIGMFARTSKAKDFRKWVLDVLEEQSLTASDMPQPMPVAETQANQYRVKAAAEALADWDDYEALLMIHVDSLQGRVSAAQQEEMLRHLRTLQAKRKTAHSALSSWHPVMPPALLAH